MRFQTNKLYSVAVLALAAGGGATPFTAPVEGSYVVTTLNGRPLPTELRLPATQGDVRLFKLEQGVLRLSEGHRFTLYFRYYHQLLRRGAKPVATPVLSEAERGTYSLGSSGELILVPAKKKGSKPRPTITATIAGQRIRASYQLDTGTSREPITLVLQRDASFW